MICKAHSNHLNGKLHHQEMTHAVFFITVLFNSARYLLRGSRQRKYCGLLSTRTEQSETIQKDLFKLQRISHNWSRRPFWGLKL